MQKIIKSDNRNNNKRNYNTDASRLSLYQRSLLMPQLNLPAKIPGTWGRRSTIFHRYTSATYTTNALGHFAMIISPNEITDSIATQGSTYYTPVLSAYDPAVNAASINVNSLDTKPYYNITSGTVKSCRMVSFSVRAYSLAPTLTRTGTIYGALHHVPPLAQSTFGGPYGFTIPTIPTIQNQIMKRANAGNGEGVQVNYLPSDEDDLAFLAPNTFYGTRHANGDDAYQLVIICQSMALSSTIKVEVDINFEIIPTPESSLAGTETPAPINDSIPALEIGHLKALHVDDLVRLISAYEGTGNGYKDKVEEISQLINNPISTIISKTALNAKSPAYFPKGNSLLPSLGLGTGNIVNQVANGVSKALANMGSLNGSKLFSGKGNFRNLTNRKPKRNLTGNNINK